MKHTRGHVEALKRSVASRLNYVKSRDGQEDYRLQVHVLIEEVFNDLIEWMPEEVQPLLQEIKRMGEQVL